MMLGAYLFHTKVNNFHGTHFSRDSCNKLFNDWSLSRRSRCDALTAFEVAEVGQCPRGSFNTGKLVYAALPC